MVRTYFLNTVSVEAVTTCFGNPFHKDTTRLQKMISSRIKSKSMIFKFESMSSGYNMIVVIIIRRILGISWLDKVTNAAVMIEYFHTDTKGTMQFNGIFSEPFKIRSGVKQGCVLAPMIFVTLFGLLLTHVLDTTTEETNFVPAQMRGSSTSPVSESRERYARISSGTSCLLMTQQLRPTPRRNSCHRWAASHMPVRISD